MRTPWAIRDLEETSRGYTARSPEDHMRGVLANRILKAFYITMSSTLIVIFALLMLEKIEVDESITIILAVSNIFAGFLGSVITYYFTRRN